MKYKQITQDKLIETLSLCLDKEALMVFDNFFEKNENATLTEIKQNLLLRFEKDDGVFVARNK